MPEENDSSSEAGPTFMAVLSEGGLPQVIAGPAGKALSRLIGEAAEIPSAWLQRYSQGIRDETKSRSQIRGAIAAAAAKRAAKNSNILDRAILASFGDRLIFQQNREAIAEKVYEQLIEDPAPSDSLGPEEDWLNFYTGHAEKATSERLRETWARVMAGEIRKPGSFSFKTLQFISVLDPKIAAYFDYYSKLIALPNLLVAPSRFDFTLNYDKLRILVEYGLITLQHTTKFKAPDGQIKFLIGQYLIMLEFAGPREFDLQVGMLTSTGSEIYSILSPETPIEAARECAHVLFRETQPINCDLFVKCNPTAIAGNISGQMYEFVERVASATSN